jgi:hypothetical protein
MPGATNKQQQQQQHQQQQQQQPILLSVKLRMLHELIALLHCTTLSVAQKHKASNCGVINSCL